MYKQIINDQHYVSSFYLKNWASPSTKGVQGIWTKTGTSVPEHVEGRNSDAQLELFYRVFVDQQVLEMMRYKYAPGWADDISDYVLAALEPLCHVTQYTHKKMPFYDRLEVINANFLENEYGKIEDPISKHLSKLAKGYWKSLLGTPSLASKSYETLLMFYSTQLCRTVSFRKSLLESIGNIIATTKSASTVFSESQKETLIKLIIYVESLRLTKKLLQQGPLINIYCSLGTEKFITSDAPAQTLRLLENQQKEIIEYQGQMPLTPSHFMTLDLGPSLPRKIQTFFLTPPSVTHLNWKFLRFNQGEKIFARSGETFDHFFS